MSNLISGLELRPGDSDTIEAFKELGNLPSKQDYCSNAPEC